ncbi:MAG: hypothetical protein K2J16_02305 [Clostridia bacterium]|nr:hypothetical protein [Clostridia bacterium]
MREARDIARRMREMLTMDKVGIKEGFSTALTNDLNRLLGDYFELTSPVNVDVVQDDGGAYKIRIDALANRIKQFDTTLDIKRY